MDDPFWDIILASWTFDEVASLVLDILAEAGREDD